MSTFIRWFVLLATLTVTTGCSVFGVYESEFSCPASYNGRCVSLPGAYDLALSGKDSAEHDPNVAKVKVNQEAEEAHGDTMDREGAAHASYKESLFKRLDTLIKEPTTPVIAPPQAMRVLLLPYKGEGNELYMLRYVYFFVDEPRWILGDSLVAPEED